MPYSSNADLPENVQGLPAEAKDTWRKIFNSAYEQYENDGKAAATAWAGLKNAGWAKAENGEWIKKLDKFKEEVEKKIKKLEEAEGPGLEDWLYLIHHVHVDETGKETIHHCPTVDHLGNLFKVEHITDEKGETRHSLTGLLDNQDVYWSNEEAEADGQQVPCANRQLEKGEL